MELKDVILQIVKQAVSAMQPTEMQIGTVTAVDPLEIKLDETMQVLKASVLYLSEPVVEKSIPILEHKHSTPAGDTDLALLESEILCDEHGNSLGTQNSRIILNPALKVGDKVQLERTASGQKFIVKSRVYDINGKGAASGGGGG